tara:strand:+ start:249 stop:527 length:279 start_codon:yes stop_codon:yes gene_type:complete
MNKSDLVKKLNNNINTFDEGDIEQSVNTILRLIADTLVNGDRVEVRNFGTFSIRSREQRVSRNPKTGTSVLVDAKHHPYFRASKFLKESLNK